MKIGTEMIFVKSGNLVRIVEQRDKKMFTVARVDTGKQMLVPRYALMEETKWNKLDCG